MDSKQICKAVDGRVQNQVILLAEQVQFMAAKLEETRKIIKSEPLVIEYDNGGGQSGIRENPSYTAYEKLLASFNKSLTTLIDIIGEGQASSEVLPLMELREKFKAVK